MTQQVAIVYPKMNKERVREMLWRAFPGTCERAKVLLIRWRDRRYRRQQSGVFERLNGLTEKPSHIEIETINRCNGTCAFCPVNRDDDPRTYQRMPEDLFHRIIDELADWGYGGSLRLYSNNEPFLDKRIFAFAEVARARLPDAYHVIISNGTALNVEKAVRILPFLSHLIINDYGTNYQLHDNIKAIIDHLNQHRPDLAGKLIVGLRRINEVKTNRAGEAPNRLNQSAVYRSRCAYPFFQMVILPDGKLSLCCNDAIGQVTLGDVSRSSIREAWASDARKEVQERMLRGRDHIGLCAGCDNLSWAKPKRIRKAIESGSFL